jgi:CYTH domain-containing protein
MLQGHQYARLERERRFLLDRFPTDQIAVRSRRITDHYIDRTTLRLREMQDDGGPRVFKLTQKIAKRGSGAQQGFITSMHLTEDEFLVLAQLPAKKLNKIRYSFPPFGVDVFKDELEGLFLAEAEFDSAVEAESLALPSFVFHEVSRDERFTGGELVRASREDLQAWLLEYGITLKP